MQVNYFRILKASRVISTCSLVVALGVFCLSSSLAFSQDVETDATTQTEDDTPEVVPQQESVTIEPYTGPPIYLPEPAEPPPAKRVESKTITEYYDPETKENPRFSRTVVRFSDDSIKSDGEYKEFYEDGQVFVEGEYNLGLRSGEWKFYHPNGTEAKTITYKDGQVDGAFEVHRADGTLKAKREFTSGERNGDWVIYGDSGEQPLIESHYKKGNPDGVWQVWYPDGTQRRQIPFANGKQNGTLIEWDEDGNKRAEVAYSDGVREGVTRAWAKDGRVIEQTYKEGKLVSTKTIED